MDNLALRTARAVMKLDCLSARVLGGMSHVQAAKVMIRFTGSAPVLNIRCQCGMELPPRTDQTDRIQKAAVLS